MGNRYRGDDPHYNHDPFVDEHDDAAQAKAEAYEAALDPERDETPDRKKANAAVDADTKDKARHIGSESKEGEPVEVKPEPARKSQPSTAKSTATPVSRPADR